VAVVSGVKVHDARVGVQDAEQAPAPARVRVPALGIDARVRPMGIEPTGEMELPRDPGTVGWYGYGPTPGDPGSAVVAGHVDGDGRPGAFFRLAELGPGARVTVTAADGSSRSFRVVSRRVFEKARLPTGSVFRRDGAPVLTLITCGGAFDRATGHYASNVVVVATPV
jgi:sortase (surface protein transpeptidase)